MAVFGTRAPLELSLTLFQVLMAFSAYGAQAPDPPERSPVIVL